MNLHHTKLAWAIAAALAAFSVSAQAQTNVTVSGLLETGVRYSTNQNAAGDNQTAFADGLINPSRLAFSGTEDLGGGMKAIFKLEAGLKLSDGSSVSGAIGDYNDPAGSRLFGREAFVGLEGDFGKITLGRQYTTGYVATWGFDPIYGGGLVVYAPYFGYVGLRQDNMVRYEKSFGAVGIQGHYVFGGQPGSGSAGSGYGLGFTFNTGGLNLSGAYQELNNDKTAVVPTKRKTAIIGGGYDFGGAKASLGYIHNTFDGIPQTNNVIVASLTLSTGTPWKLTGVAYHDKQSSADGKHSQFVGLAEYSMSKRTTLFVEADYNKYADAMLPFGPTGKDNQSGFTLGMRHTF
jgi:predicted porin